MFMAVYTDILKELRKDRKLTQAQMGKLLGISQRVYSFYESGEHEMGVDTLAKIADIFGVTTDYILRRSCENKKP